MDNLEERFKNMHLLNRVERFQLINELEIRRPDFMAPFTRPWWRWRRCPVNVLIVCDGGLNFGTNDFDLSEFLTAFNRLEATSWVDYKVTLAHRGSFIVNSPNPVVVGHIANFNFENSVNLADFDQLWLFAISSSGGLTTGEKNAVEGYMDGGGGIFATGDHGSLGRAMCGEIPRVKDMRYWNDYPSSLPNDVNEVSMGGKRRNDTNRPASGDSTSLHFNNQSDEIPQEIAVRTFAAGIPHPLLSIKKSLRPSGIIDIMPDHPHEGECAPETSFTVNGITLSTQIISTSFVLGGSTTANGSGKELTVPHCFPGIAVWDGKRANVGRIVVDSTWHHFVNINLNGLHTSDFAVIQQYYMNIATWMTRKKNFFCFRRYVLFDLFRNSQLIEATLNNPVKDLREISLADLNSIGALAEEVLASKFSPAFARNFLLELMEEYNKDFVDLIDIWKPEEEKKSKQKENAYYQPWLNFDLALYTSIGAAFIALRDDERLFSDDVKEKGLERIYDVFSKGLDFGFTKAISNLEMEINKFNKKINGNDQKMK